MDPTPLSVSRPAETGLDEDVEFFKKQLRESLDVIATLCEELDWWEMGTASPSPAAEGPASPLPTALKPREGLVQRDPPASNALKSHKEVQGDPPASNAPESKHPSLSLLQKSPSSPVSCHATGFYPNRALMFWRKDGEEIHENVDHGEILPNDDGTFQMRVYLNISSISPEDWRRYDCVFQLHDKEEIIKLDETVIRTNRERHSNITIPIIAAVIAFVLVSIIAAAGYVVYKRNRADETHFELISET
ncbi:HLA class I histocompatibility antigen, alpha chain G-like [Fundulus heteroclitus]|uniref:HLA class I histocompatibility antigen, alpha chain G-like n=1 Tax=Fundulus heteroclitus TaxID=8078 RepID=UPI00165B9C48|nr:HLA class I histocompatibility antigen, alpha chain G-like [Fundulus heteroclitus]